MFCLSKEGKWVLDFKVFVKYAMKNIFLCGMVDVLHTKIQLGGTGSFVMFSCKISYEKPQGKLSFRYVS